MKLRRLASLFTLAVVCLLITGETSFGAPSYRAKSRVTVRSKKKVRTTPAEAFESRVQTFIQESGGAQIFLRAFAPIKDGVPGAARRVITVSRASFPTFARLFSGKDVLFLYHAPNSRNLITAFNGYQGEQGRLLEDFNFNYAGTLLIPIVLSEAEGARAHDFFQLAGRVRRRNDFALFPWLLKDATATVSYMPAGNANLLSDWFMRMPIGASLDESHRRETYSTAGMEPEIATLVQRVWTAPFAHQTLAQALDLRPLDPVRLFKTPGTVAGALLGTASFDRVPVVFRFVENDSTPLQPDFGNFIDVDFNPGENG